MITVKDIWNGIITRILNHSLKCQCITKYWKCCKNNQKFKVSYLDTTIVKTVFCCGVHLRHICKKPVFSVYIRRKKKIYTPYHSLIIKYDRSPIPDNKLVKLTKKIVNILSLLISKMLFTEQYQEDMCCICLQLNYSKFSFRKNITLSCNHTFHDKCITKWMQHKNTCPLCREDISMN